MFFVPDNRQPLGKLTGACVRIRSRTGISECLWLVCMWLRGGKRESSWSTEQYSITGNPGRRPVTGYGFFLVLTYLAYQAP
jgi:hypothetical protein